MINFPVFNSIQISNYGLFPISEKSPLEIAFQQGPTVIVGVNGSGKSTLINLLLRLMTGPYDLPSGRSDEELGQIRPELVKLDRSQRSYFASRVADGAKDASAKLTLTIGKTNFVISRRLVDMKLTSFSVQGIESDASDEEAVYHKEISEKVGVGSFFDVVIILRYLIFMLEDRRSLVWDKTAQRQIFRVLVLPPHEATSLASAQKELISSDSAYRNTFNMISRSRVEQQQVVNRISATKTLQAELGGKKAQAAALQVKLEESASERISLENERRKARLSRLRSAESREGSMRELERSKFRSLKHWLEPSDGSLQYILGQLLANQKCLVCGTDPSPGAAVIESRLKSGFCPICGVKHKVEKNIVDVSKLDMVRIENLEKDIQLAEVQIAEADEKIELFTVKLKECEQEYESRRHKSINLDREILGILRKMPAESSAVSNASQEINALDRILDRDKQKRDLAASAFERQTAQVTQAVQSLQRKIANNFDKFIEVFLREQATLVYQTVQEKVAQGLPTFTFPVFRLAMSGGAISGSTVREGPSEVSQSQAEFVDLAFRMALLTVASSNGPSTMIVDAPEASLDFLFATRAGEQLAAFGSSNTRNRVIATSYLPSAHFVGAFIDGIKGREQRKKRILNLIEIAAPNAAIRADKKRYNAFLKQIIEKR